MSTPAPDILDRLYELLAERQNGTLSDAQAAELESLLATPEARAAEAEFEASHAALLLAFKDPTPARMPADARARLETIGVAIVAPAAPRRSSSLGWIAAVIAGLIAAAGWLRTPPPAPTPPVAREPSIAEKLAMLLADQQTARVALAAQTDKNATGASGEVVWNQQKQQGYLRIKGLAPNDPAIEQYQLWIFDAQRETYPIDGGVFDVAQAATDPATGDTIIPMRPALAVGKPAAFAVTAERPGGVVVTTKERLCLLGAVN